MTTRQAHVWVMCHVKIEILLNQWQTEQETIEILMEDETAVSQTRNRALSFIFRLKMELLYQVYAS